MSTSDLSMVAVVTDTAGSIRARVDFAWGDRGAAPNQWSRCEGDSVKINGEEATETERDDRVEYSVTLDAVSTPRTFDIVLDRERDNGSVAASVTLPESFDITAPVPNEEIARGIDLVLEWTPPAPDAEMQIQLLEEIGGGICLITPTADHDYKAPGGVRVPDTGRWTIPAGIVGSDQEACEAAYQLRRFSTGGYPSSLAEGGFLEGRVIRSLSFVSVP